MKVRIEKVDDSRLACSPAEFLGASFSSYLEATRRADATFDRANKRQVVDLERAADLAAALVDAGFEIVADSDARPLFAAEAERLEYEADDIAAELAAREVEWAERGLQLYGFQRAGVQWLMMRKDRGALLGDDMGLGKTVQALCALPAGAPVLVVVKTKTLRSVWRTHARDWAPHFDVTVARRRDQFRWPEAGEIVIVSAHTLPEVEKDSRTKRWSLVEDIGMPAPGTVLIADECHTFKSSGAQRTQSMRKVCAKLRRRAAWIWLLSGTPMEKHPQELYNVLQLAKLADEAFGGWGGYTDAFHASRGAFGWEWGKPGPDVPRMLAKVMLRRTRAEELDLPPIRYERIGVDIASGPRSAIAKAQQDLLWDGVDVESMRTADDLAAAEGLAFQACSRLRAALADAKTATAVDLATEYEDAGEPVVVFSCHRGPVEALEAREGWSAVHGGVGSDDRDAAIAAFQDGRLRGLAVTVGAGAEGITLTRAAHMVIVDLPWNPSVMDQVTARIHRISQERAVVVRVLVADHVVDQRVDEIHAEKRAVVSASVQAAGRVRRAPVAETLRELAAKITEAGAEPAPAPAVVDPDEMRRALTRLPAARYAAETADGSGVAFWRVDRPDDGKWRGWVFLRQQVGPRFARYASFDPDGRTRSPQGASVVLRLAEDPEGAIRRYGLEVGRCGVCGSPLTDEESRAAGIGPVCARRFA